MWASVFAHLGAPVQKKCARSVVAGDLSKPSYLPGVAPAADPEKTPAIPPSSKGLTWTKILIGGLVVYAGGKMLGWI